MASGQDVLDRSRSDAVLRVLAAGSVLLIGLHVSLYYGVTTAALPVALLFPVWTAALSRFRGARSLMMLTLLTLLSGALLAELAAAEHRVDAREALASTTLLATGIGAVGVLLWASRVFPTDRIALLYGVGMLIGEIAAPGKWGSTPWKHGLAFPMAVIALTVLQRMRSGAASLTVLVALGAVSVVLDYRSFLGFCALTVLLLLWQRASPPAENKRNRFAPLLLLGAVGLAVYFLVSNLLVRGYLGASLQQRSIAQIDASGSLLIGGRPEWSATVQLMRMNPWGYGVGVVPNADDLMAGKQGFANINVDYNNGYIEKYMLGGQFHLHSIIADLWSSGGLVGLVLAVAIVGTLLTSLSVALSERRASAVLVLVVLVALWDMGFGPIFSNLTDVTLALALALSGAHRRGAPPAVEHHDVTAELILD